MRNPELKGTALQDAAEKAGFEPSFVVLALFPQVVNFMADNIAWTTQARQGVRGRPRGVLDSVQRLRAEAKDAGNLKSTPQQTVETKTTSSGEQVIVIEPANPQVVYVPQYNPQVVYTQPRHDRRRAGGEQQTGAAVGGRRVGFAAGIAIGAAMDNDYYYGPYGWHGGAYMYNDAWDDYYDDRQDAREDYYENREDAREDYYENREDARENAGDRLEDGAAGADQPAADPAGHGERNAQRRHIGGGQHHESNPDDRVADGRWRRARRRVARPRR